MRREKSGAGGVKKPAQSNKNRLIFIIYAVVLGGITGGIAWLFLKIMDICLKLIWETLPMHINSAWYPVAVCALGGLLIGVCQKKVGLYPETLEVVMHEVKQKGGYERKNALGIALCALLPLVFGGSIGPEAGLTGIIAVLCTWIGKRFKHLASEMRELAVIGMSATLSTIFNAPLFGFLAPIESVDSSSELPKIAKTTVYFAAIFGGLGSFVLLKNAFGGGMSIERFGECYIGKNEIIWFVPLAIAGAAAGYLYFASERLAGLLCNHFQRFVIFRGIVGGALLGLCGVFLPFTMFAGETQMGDIMNGWLYMSVPVLFFSGFFKIIITNICLKTGWRGGNIFPLIFSGVCFGYSIARMTGIDGVFAAAAVTAALCGFVMRKPLTVTMLLLICFPIKSIIAIIAAAFVGASISNKQ